MEWVLARLGPRAYYCPNRPALCGADRGECLARLEYVPALPDHAASLRATRRYLDETQ